MMKKCAFISAIAFFTSLVSVTSHALDMPDGEKLKDAAVELISGNNDAAESVAADATVTADGAIAATEEAPASEGFAAIDANADGMISMDEAQAVENAGLLEGWSTVDANADGQLDAAEFSAFELTDVPAVEVPAIEVPAIEVPAAPY